MKDEQPPSQIMTTMDADYELAVRLQQTEWNQSQLPQGFEFTDNTEHRNRVQSTPSRNAPSDYEVMHEPEATASESDEPNRDLEATVSDADEEECVDHKDAPNIDDHGMKVKKINGDKEFIEKEQSVSYIPAAFGNGISDDVITWIQRNWQSQRRGRGHHNVRNIKYTSSDSSQNPFIIIDLENVSLKLTKYILLRSSGKSRKILPIKLKIEGTNDENYATTKNWTIIHILRQNTRDELFYVDGDDIEFFSKFRIEITATQSAVSLSIDNIKLYGDTVRKVFKTKRYNEDPTYPKIGDNLVVGDSNNVLTMINDSDALQHMESDEYKADISGSALDLYDFQKQGISWMLDREAMGVGGFICDEMGMGKTVTTVNLLLSPIIIYFNKQCYAFNF